MAAYSSRSDADSADSYIGCLISITLKSEIRYEGDMYNINAKEYTIGLINVKSFGTEGLKKDGPQVPPNDRVYEYIPFRRSDIKDLEIKAMPPVQSTPTIHEIPAIIQDLEVKAIPPVQPTPTIHEIPAIIQSHSSCPTSMSTSFPAAGSGSVADPSCHTLQLGQVRSPFQGGMPLYQPGGSVGYWGFSPPPPITYGSAYWGFSPPPNTYGNAYGSELVVPIYWQGLYGYPGGLQHGQQQSMAVDSDVVPLKFSPAFDERPAYAHLDWVLPRQWP